MGNKTIIWIGCLALVAGVACSKAEKASPAPVSKGAKSSASKPEVEAAESAQSSKAAAAKTSTKAQASTKAPGASTSTVSSGQSAPPEALASNDSAAPAGQCAGGGSCGGCGYGAGGGTQVAGAGNSPKVAHFGAPFTLTNATPISEVLAKTQKTSDKLVKVSGRIDAVCQKKGCWLVVTDGKMKARIKMKDYGFTVPINSKGKQAVVEGTVTVKVWNEKMVKHLEEDAGRDPAKVSGTRREYLLTATGIDIRS